MASSSTHELLLKIEGTAEDAQRALAEVGASIDHFGRKKAIATADINTKRGQATLTKFEKQLREFDMSEFDAEVQLQASAAFVAIKLLKKELRDIESGKTTVDVDTAKGLIGRFQAIQKQVRGITEATGGEVTIEVKAHAEDALRDAAAVKAAYDQLDRSVFTSEVELEIRRAMANAKRIEAELAKATKRRNIDVGLTDRLTQELREANRAVEDAFEGKGQEHTIAVRADITEALRKSQVLEDEYKSKDLKNITTDARLEIRNALLAKQTLDRQLHDLTKDRVIDVEMAEGLLADLRQAQIEVREAFDDMNDDARIEVKTKMDNALVEMETFKERLRLLNTQRATPEVKLIIREAMIRASTLDSRLNRLTRDRDFDVDFGSQTVKEFEALQRSIGKTVDEMGDFGTRFKQAFQDAGPGATQFARVLKGLTPFIAGIATLVGAALVPAIGALVASLGAAIGAVGALGAAMVASLGPAVSLLIGLFSRLAAIFNAKQAQDQAAAVGARNQAQAAQRSADAARQEAAAADAVRNAQQQLVTARRQYADATRQARKEIADSAQDERNAIQAVADAERDLAKARKGLREAKTEAKDSIAEALKERDDAIQAVQESQEELARTTIDANRAMEDAIERVTDAQLDLRDATLSLEEAKDKVSDLEREIAKMGESLGAIDPSEFLQKLTDVDLQGLDVGSMFAEMGLEADEAATEALTDKLRELERAKLDVDKAADKLTDTETELSRAQEDQAKFVTQGLNAFGPYKAAVEGTADAQEKLTEATDEYNKLNTAGIAGANGVVSARERLRDATRSLATAERESAEAAREHDRLVSQGVANAPAVISAQEAMRDASEGIAAANRQASQSFDSMSGRAEQSAAAAAQQFAKLSKQEQIFVGFVRRLGSHLRGAIQGGSDAILLSFRKAMRDLGPLVAGAEPIFTRLGQVWGASMEQAAEALRDDDWVASFQIIGDAAIALSAVGAQAFGKFVETFRNIAVAAIPSLERISIGIRDFFTSTASGTGNIATLGDTIAWMTDHLEVWLSLTWQLTRAFGGFVAAANEPSLEFVGWLRDGAKALADWSNSDAGRARIKQFFEDTLPMVKELLRLIGRLGIIFLQLVEFMAPSLRVFIAVFRVLFETMSSVLEVMNKLPTPVKAVLGGFLLFGPMVRIFQGFFVIVRFLLSPLGILINLMRLMGLQLNFLTISARAALLATGIGALIVLALVIATHWKETKKILGAVWGWIKRTVTDLGAAVAGAFKGAIDFVKGAAEKGFLGPIPLIIARWGEIVTFFKGLPAKIGNLGGAILDSVLSGFGDVAGAVAGVFEPMVNWIKDELPALVLRYHPGLLILRAILTIGTSVIDATAQKFGGIVNWIRDIPVKIGAVGARILNGILTVGRSVVEATAEKFGGVVSWVKSIPEKVGELGGKILDAIGSGAGNVYGWAAEKFGGVFDFIKTLPEKVTNIGSRILEGIWNGIESKKNWFIDKIKDLLPGWMEKGLSILSPSKAMFPIGKQITAGMAVGMIQNAKVLTKASRDLGGAIEAPTVEAGASIDVSGLLDGVTQAVGQAGDLGSDAGAAIVDSVSAGMQDSPESVTESATWLQETFGDSVGGEDRNFQGIGAWVTDTVMKGARLIQPGLTGFGHWLFGQLQTTVHGQGPNYSRLGGWITGVIMAGARAGLATIAPFGSTLRDNVRGDVERFNPDFKAMGDAAAKKIVEGMTQAVNTEAEVKEFGDMLVKSIEAFFGIKSPSRVFMGIGEHLTHGLIKGIRSPDAAGVWRGLVGNPLKIIRSQFGNVTRFARGLVLNAPDWVPGKDLSSFDHMAKLGLEMWDRDDMQLASIPDRLFDEIMGFPAGVLKRYFGKESPSDMVAIAIAVGKNMRAKIEDFLAAVAAGLVESNLTNVPAGKGDRDSVGVLQQRPSQGWGKISQLLNPFYAFRKFYEHAIPKSIGDPGKLAQAVQKSAFPDRYNERLGEAVTWLRKFGMKVPGRFKEYDAPGMQGAAPLVGAPTWNQDDLKRGIINLGRFLKRLAYQVSEHPAFGGVNFEHTGGSAHYVGRALDINRDQGSEAWHLDKLYAFLRRLYKFRGDLSQVLWRVRDHFDHLHIGFPKLARGGIITGPVAALVGEGGNDEAVLPLTARVFKMLGDAIVAALDLTKIVAQIQAPSIIIQPKINMPAITIPSAVVPAPATSTIAQEPQRGDIHINVPPSIDGGQPDARITAALLEQELRRRGGLR